jgi:UDP-galactopyranose mutase
MPINLSTINSFFKQSLTPTQAAEFLSKKRVPYADPQNFEDQALSLIGPELYHAFIRGYTLKQWETDPTLLPASYARRLPVRTNYNDRYYNDLYEGIPVKGYTPIFEKMLTHENIKLFLNTDWFEVQKHVTNQLVIYTGPIDRYYNYQFGRLNWRTIDIDFQTKMVGDYQGVPQINYPHPDISCTRVIEHRHFHPERKDYPVDKTVIGVEYSRSAQGDDTVYYPVNTPEDRDRYTKYRELADAEPNTIIGGRLGEYMYYDMHQVIGAALSCYKNKIQVKLQQ